MQLQDPNSFSIACPRDFANACLFLAQTIGTPAEKNNTFSQDLHRYQEFCPRLFDAFNESKKPLNKRSLDERLHLKQKLIEDFEANITAADAQFGGAKLLGTDTLPSDPKECLERLIQMEKEVFTQIKTLELKLRYVESAQKTMEKILKRKLELDAIDKTPFMSFPQELAGKNKKARRE